MPTNTTFKVQCPSCEAQVPIRDPRLIGKKIDCPKCKYRFVVEEPGDEALEEAAAPERRARPKPKKKAGANNMLILGSVLGVVALALLCVGGYFLFFHDSSPSAPPVTQPVAPFAKSTTPPMDNPGAAPAGNPDQPGTAAATAAAPQAAPASDTLAPGAPTQVPFNDISNLLPNDAQTVYAVHMDRMRACTLGQQAFESRVGFRPETFRQKLGIGVEEIARFVRAENLESNWSFNVFRTIRPVTLDELKPALGLVRADKSPIQGREYYRLAPNDLLDNLSTILQSEVEIRDARAPADAEEKGKKPKSGPLMILQVDPSTFVIATQEPMEEFLEAGAKWEFKSRPAPGSDDPNNPTNAPATSEAVRPKGRGNRGGAPDAATGADTGPQFTNKHTFLCIEPALKAMMDELEGDGQDVIATIAQRLQSNAKIVDRLRDVTGIRQLEVRGMNILGIVLNEFNNSRFKGHIDLEMFRENDAKALEEAVKAVMPSAGQALSLYLGGLKIDVDGSSGGGPSTGRTGGPGNKGGAAIGVGGDTIAPGTSTGGPGGASGDGPKSTLNFHRNSRMLTLAADLNLNIKAYDRLYGLGESIVVRMKGMVDMADRFPRWHELAAAAVKTAEKDGSVPRGTYMPEEMVGGRVVRLMPPHLRVGWLASLLPYLGQQDLYNRIDLKKSWRSEENLKQGAILIPQFLNPNFARQSWRATVPSLGLQDQGATHVVGVAGVGVDAADYMLNDPSVAKKIGVVGYDRRMRLKDVADGAANTMYMIQVPPNQPRPWIAGGGATVTGIPEKDSVRPFVVTGANGKRGATVLMLDGTVRFVSETVSDDVFKALATANGGESVIDLEKQFPKVEPKKKPELRTASAAGATDASGAAKPPSGDLK